MQLVDNTGLVVRETVSGGQGTFELPNVPEGEYLLAASARGRMAPQQEVRVRAGETTEVEIRFGSELGRNSGEVDREILAMQEQLRAMQGRLERLVEERELARRKTQEPESVQVASLSAGPAVAALSKPQESGGGLYGSLQAGAPEEKAAERPTAAQKGRPGAGFTNKGLYGGLAPGAEGRRYSRGLFGDMIKIGGYGSFRFEANDVPDGPQIGDLPPLNFSHNSFDFRRLVLTVDAAPTKRLRFYSEIEFERLNEIEVERNAIPENRGRATRDRRGTRFIQEVEGTSRGEIALEQAWGQFNFNDVIGVRGGVVLPPVGRFNIYHDDDYWDLPRRTLVDRGGPVLPTKVAWREVGVGAVITKPVGDGYFDAQAYVVNGPKMDFAMEEVVSLREGRNLLELEPEVGFSSGAFDGSQTTAGLAWRTALSPKLGHEVALSGYHGQYTPDYLTAHPWVHTIAVDGKTTLGNFEVEGEFVHTDFHGFRGVIDDIAAQFVDSAAKTFSSETSILESEVEAEFAGPLTESRKGFWIDFKYRLRPKWLQQVSELDDPHFIPILRWERIWFHDFVRGFEFADSEITNLRMEDTSQERITAGLALRLMPSVVVSAAWEYNRLLSGSNFIWPQPVGTDPIPGDRFSSFIVGMAFGF